jgi:hypothetical protein
MRIGYDVAQIQVAGTYGRLQGNEDPISKSARSTETQRKAGDLHMNRIVSKEYELEKIADRGSLAGFNLLFSTRKQTALDCRQKRCDTDGQTNPGGGFKVMVSPGPEAGYAAACLEE